MYRDEAYKNLLRKIRLYNAFCDWPWLLCYERLGAYFADDARYILTRKKSTEIWVESLIKHELTMNLDSNACRAMHGYDYPHGLEKEHISLYNAHLKRVGRHFLAKGKSYLLCELCWEDGDGWK